MIVFENDKALPELYYLLILLSPSELVFATVTVTDCNSNVT